MDQYHEPPNELSMQTRDVTRALMSLKEEIEAIDWYNQRMEACGEEKLKAILEHNRNEEMEHACMALEWLRQNMPGWDEQMKKYLFAEQAGQEKEQAGQQDQGDLGLSRTKK